jgi:predicted ATP-grasp superfamily ATP-dependent carboligase
MQPTQPSERTPGPVQTGSGSSPPVLALGAGITLLGVLRTLGRRHVSALTLSDDDALVRHSRWFRAAPEGLRSPCGGGALSDYLAGSPLASAVLVPCSDDWSRDVAALDPSLRSRFPASVSDAEVQRTLVDKGAFARLLERTGTPHPRTLLMDDPQDLDEADPDLIEHGFLKPRNSQAFFQRYQVKAYRPRDADDLRAQMQVLAGEGMELILQEYVPGPASNHYFVDGFLDRDSRVRTRLVRQRLRMYPPDFGNSSYMRSVAAREAGPAVDAIEALLTGLGYRGVYSAEFKKDPRDGAFRLLEVNARPWWYVDFAARCGVDVVWMAYRDALGEAVPDTFDYEVGRTLAFPHYDVSACLEAAKAGETSFGACLASWAGSDRCVFAWDDPLPALRDAMRNAARSLVRRVTGRWPALRS